MSCDAAMAVGRRHGSLGRNHDRRGNRRASGHRTVQHAPRHAARLVPRRAARHAPRWAFPPLSRARLEHRNSSSLALQALILAMTVAAAGPVATLFRDTDPTGATRELNPIITVNNSNLGDTLLAGARCHPDAPPGVQGAFHVGFATRAVSCPIAQPSLPISRAVLAPNAGRTTTTPVPAPPSGTPAAGTGPGNGGGGLPVAASTKTPQPPPVGLLTAGLRGPVAATRKANKTEILVGVGADR
ncbi:hypothetical protein FsymDg_0322 [Candidatus Protofrankia datiscae]|uniref:Uncharacterized protein n=2 Tax=Frankiaceae TaxID=74712 RepID=F8B0X1_9ACTN|nr:hypothetical protein FsymDg_0322 [Candidatus Protofrankia datiscae]